MADQVNGGPFDVVIIGAGLVGLATISWPAELQLALRSESFRGAADLATALRYISCLHDIAG